MTLPTIEQQVTFVYTRELERAAGFFGGVLGLDLIRDQGACRIYRTAPGAAIGVCDHVVPPPAPDGVMLTLVVARRADVEAWHDHLVANGVEIAQPPTAKPRFEIYALIARSPDGHRIEIQAFDAPLDG